jgi:flavin-dependent dehydrogenase
MMGGKIAAESILKMRDAGNFTAEATKKFEQAWMKRFGHDFYWSQAFAEAIYRCPILMDAVANETQRSGDRFMSVWAEVATCMRPKTDFFRPSVAVPLAFALVREVFRQKVLGKTNYDMPLIANGKATGK